MSRTALLMDNDDEQLQEVINTEQQKDITIYWKGHKVLETNDGTKSPVKI